MSTVFHRHMTQRVSSDPYWQYNCTAYSAAMLINDATLGGQQGVTGAHVRKLSDEPIPDKASPGLNISQVVTVAQEHFHVGMANRIGKGWNELMHELQFGSGRRILAQIEYKPLGAYRCQADGDFTHAVVLVRASPNALLVSDPLCSAVKWIPKTNVHNAMVGLARTTGHSDDFLWWAMSRPVPRTA